MRFITSLTLLIALFSFTACAQNKGNDMQEDKSEYPIQKSEAEWKAALSEKAYYVLRESGTEIAFTGEYNKFDKEGTYHCAGCNAPLFSSKTKFDSGTGWPSFYDVLSNDNVKAVDDYSYGRVISEVVCNQCGGHLGHVFEDGPRPTGLRYCINSVSIDFEGTK
jgi:peptide-methionine (R)-S-oxide reductase